MNYKFFVGALFTSILIASCKKETNELASSSLAPLTIEFDNIVGGENLYLTQRTYVNNLGEPYTIDYLQYYVSNFQLQKADGSIYVIPQDSSYFLIKEHDVAYHKVQVSVPEGDYTALIFTLGIDSVRNTLGLENRTGILDPTNLENEGMYWGWNSGYIFFKMEGTSAAAPTDGNGFNKFRYHIGGFGGYHNPTINNIKTISIDLTNRGIAKVRSSTKSNIHLFVDVAKIFDGGTNVSIAQQPTVMFTDFSTIISDNYSSMFTHDHTEN